MACFKIMTYLLIFISIDIFLFITGVIILNHALKLLYEYCEDKHNVRKGHRDVLELIIADIFLSFGGFLMTLTFLYIVFRVLIKLWLL